MVFFEGYQEQNSKKNSGLRPKVQIPKKLTQIPKDLKPPPHPRGGMRKIEQVFFQRSKVFGTLWYWHNLTRNHELHRSGWHRQPLARRGRHRQSAGHKLRLKARAKLGTVTVSWGARVVIPSSHVSGALEHSRAKAGDGNTSAILMTSQYLANLSDADFDVLSDFS